MLIYDTRMPPSPLPLSRLHLPSLPTVITLSDEVERIWKRPFSGATALFLLNRWGTPFEFAVVVAAFHTKWEDSVGQCDSRCVR